MKWRVLLVAWLLKGELSVQERTLLTTLVLDKLNALPLRDIITNSEDGKVLINGEPLDYERALLIRESARSALNNPVRKLVWEQIAYIAGRRGVLEGDTPEKLYFYRAATWFLLQEEEYLRKLGQVESLEI